MNFPFAKNRLRGALERGFASGDLDEEIEELGELTLKSRADGEAICWALQELKRAEPAKLQDNVRTVAGLFQEVVERDCAAFEVLQERGIPELIQLFDKLDDKEERGFGVRLFLLKILAMYGTTAGTLKIVEAARQPVDPGGYLWTVILQNFSAEHPEKDLLFRELSDPLPQGFIGVSLLDAANALLIAGDSMTHPFDTEEGRERLRAWLTSSDPEQFSYAHSATAALPFISSPVQDELLDLAMNHPDAGVQMEAAWAAAKLGRLGALERLIERARDFRTASMAVRYLTELEREDLIPDEATDPSFDALAQFAQWLAHPNELGRVPDELTIADERELAWPPSGEAKPFWLIKYLTRDTTGLEEDEEECGLVGSVTFCFFSYKLAERPPEDCYAIHCYWEMEQAALIEETDVRGEAHDYERLFEEWTGRKLEKPKLAFIAELSPELNYRQRIVGLASARVGNEDGWVVLDGPRSEFYPKASQPADAYESVILKIHVGRQLLGFGRESNRAKYLAPPKPPKTNAQIVGAYEKHLAAARAAQGEKREEAFNVYSSLIAKHFVRYAEALDACARGEEIRPLVRELAQNWQEHVEGLGLLARGALSSGHLDLAEEFLVKLRSQASMFERSDEVDSLARLWFRQGKAAEARQLLLESLRKLFADGQGGGSDGAWIEECYQSRRAALLGLFPNEAEALLAAEKLPASIQPN